MINALAARWLIAAIIALAVGASHLLDGPTELEAEQATGAAARDVERAHLADAGPQE